MTKPQDEQPEPQDESPRGGPSAETYAWGKGAPGASGQAAPGRTATDPAAHSPAAAYDSAVYGQAASSGRTADVTAEHGEAEHGTPERDTAAQGTAGHRTTAYEHGTAAHGGGDRGEAAQDEGTRRLERAVLAAERALIEFEIAVETFRVEVENFSRLHHQRLGPMYSRLDELDARIAEAIAARTGSPEDVRKAREARAAVLPMPDVEELFHGWMGSDGLYSEAQAMLTDQPVRPPGKVRPSEEARRVYRDLVRKAHPDLARDDAERERRDTFIVRVNAAYAAGDEATLRALAEEWAKGPAPKARPLSEGEELYARLEWLAERKELLAAIAAELEESAIGAMIKMAHHDPDGLLDEIAEKLLADVAERESRLARLVG